MEGQGGAWQVPGYTRIREVSGDGRVVLARHDDDGTEVVIGYLDSPPGDEEAVARFRADARLLASVDEPRVVRPREYVEGEEGAAIIREAAEGEPLRRILDRAGPLPPEAALALLKDTLLGLAAAHRAGVAHGDVRPDHVLVTADGTGRLAGFGVAHLVRSSADDAGPYLPPGEERADGPAADLYAAAVTFAEALTGERPGEADRDRHPPPVEHVPEPLRELAGYGTAARAEDRPESAERFLERLAEAAAAGYGADWEERGRVALRESSASPDRAAAAPGRTLGTPGGAFALNRLDPTAKLAVVGALTVVTVAAIVAVFAILGEPASTTSQAGPEVPVAVTTTLTPAPATPTSAPATDRATPAPSRPGTPQPTRAPEPAPSRTSAADPAESRPRTERPRTRRPTASRSGRSSSSPTTRRPSRTPTRSATRSATPRTSPPATNSTPPGEPPTEDPDDDDLPTDSPEEPEPDPDEPGIEPPTS
ncbi:hypothetical protein GCM10010106_22340 [Thermopolyspora flexuosa]|jgi:serine/threonine-protein kinase|uniref:Serine/threonine-protein kinase n=1 Tax=Thermopolyspora flexuosa TaxID=103836 RepID=A0A543J309_9ACTN|nr:serine/threonine-protein kinase [Thermopolyspora flexuosa]TQM77192.1 serine/threonine-protein kinase [Thermopolyspora flexuosa]GGM75376.1 hypothetical protein GCM10010106_22340 [Thermopolyspora flexuosa]